MFRPTAPPTFALLLGVLVLLVADNRSFIAQANQQFTINEIWAKELFSSMVFNQIAVLRILNESSTICSLHENSQRNIRELDVEIQEFKNEVQLMKESTLNELQNTTATSMNKMEMKNVEVKQDLNDFKEAALEELQRKTTAALQELQRLVTLKRKNYRKYDLRATQPQSIEACKQLGGRLALPTNKEEDEQIRREIGVSFSNEAWYSIFYWISGTDQQEEGNWIDSITGEPLRYTNYYPGEPNNAYGKEDCLQVGPLYLGWADRGCEVVGNGYVCEFINE